MSIPSVPFLAQVCGGGGWDGCGDGGFARPAALGAGRELGVVRVRPPGE